MSVERLRDLTDATILQCADPGPPGPYWFNGVVFHSPLCHERETPLSQYEFNHSLVSFYGTSKVSETDRSLGASLSSPGFSHDGIFTSNSYI
jgi:hypothetical protein